ncbi:two-component system, OmpR family, sensor histidine kinase KdpD [Rhizobiales bacterium GAS113]|nr:two-component system, OmpR family, sensor histidine kinase KdpD [Rhizobiales bacterium GAS113]
MAQADSKRGERPDPDALLALVKSEGRGKLKVFLGAAPGVGKTYAMLSGAKQAAREGVDVVIGLVETHGRSETAALIAGLEMLPQRNVEYRGRIIQEFDIDAALKRRPKLVIVDELAHTNAPESRHPKRYQDIEELIAAGIDVWTAVNIQHLESLSDVVSTITGVSIRETVPDTVVEKADEVVVVDITPAELIQRLKDGKVYLPENAKRAADNFFKPGNLTALRELALRRTADRVDDQMVVYLRQNAIEGPWPAAERILVCVGTDPLSETVVRAGSRLASGLNASWIAVHLSRSDFEETSYRALKRIDDAMRLAERLGAEMTRLTAKHLPDELLRYARRENVTQIVLGRSAAHWFARLRGRSLPEEIVRRASGIAVHIVTSDQEAPRRSFAHLWPRLSALAGVVPFLSVAAAVGIGLVASHYLVLPNLSMIFLTAVLFCAVSYGAWSAIIAAVLSFLAYNFFFIEPVYTLTVAEPHELFALLIFLLVAVLTGGLAGRVREQSDAAASRVVATQSLYDFSRKLSAIASLDDVLWVVVSHVAKSVNGGALVLLGKGEELELSAALPPEDNLGPSEWAAARWSATRGELAGWRTATLPNAQFQFRPLRTSRGILGVIGITAADTKSDLSDDTDRALSALIDQAAVAIERTQLVDEASRAEAAVESERLRGALLSSLSHDLRTPLSSIMGAVTSLRQLGDKMPAASRRDLLITIEEETARLSRFVSNLLDMTRLEAGAVSVKRDLVDAGDTVRNAVAHARANFPTRPIEVSVAADLPFVRGDATLLEQVVFNLLDNADKYVPHGLPTMVSVSSAARKVTIAVTDRGPGIPQAELERVFEKFHRVAHGDGRPAGTGLGLSICRGLIAAMDGSIRAESPVGDGKGTRIVVELPAAEAAQDRLAS